MIRLGLWLGLGLEINIFQKNETALSGEDYHFIYDIIEFRNSEGLA